MYQPKVSTNMNKPTITSGAGEIGTGKIVDTKLDQATGKIQP